ncbi:hypothetical protein X777_02420 [Ooceraea biroi]|uniref:Uncharacterized protein n=1 Tax=Ooceraea biroi TaxID=2015173 RepID=A0A026WMW3_OOCBI|nr:hypothetical protein X777_02420 [Ooceraea biroi]
MVSSLGRLGTRGSSLNQGQSGHRSIEGTASGNRRVQPETNIKLIIQQGTETGIKMDKEDDKKYQRSRSLMIMGDC